MNRVILKCMTGQMQQMIKSGLNSPKRFQFRWSNVGCTVLEIKIDEGVQMMVKLTGEIIDHVCYRFEEHFEEEVFWNLMIMVERGAKTLGMSLK